MRAWREVCDGVRPFSAEFDQAFSRGTCSLARRVAFVPPGEGASRGRRVSGLRCLSWNGCGSCAPALCGVPAAAARRGSRRVCGGSTRSAMPCARRGSRATPPAIATRGLSTSRGAGSSAGRRTSSARRPSGCGGRRPRRRRARLGTPRTVTVGPLPLRCLRARSVCGRTPGALRTVTTVPLGGRSVCERTPCCACARLRSRRSVWPSPVRRWRASVPLMLAGPVAWGRRGGGGRGYAPSVRGRVSKITVTVTVTSLIIHTPMPSA